MAIGTLTIPLRVLTGVVDCVDWDFNLFLFPLIWRVVEDSGEAELEVGESGGLEVIDPFNVCISESSRFFLRCLERVFIFALGIVL